jgi:hypothetical protein
MATKSRTQKPQTSKGEDDWDDRSPRNNVDVNRPKTKEEILWSEYAIQPNLPIRTKVEQLMLLWRLPVPQIALALDLTETLVKEEVKALNDEWLALGRPLDEETKQVVRGKMIAELMRLKAEIESAAAGNPDTRLLTLKLQVIEKLTKVQGLDVGKDAAYEEQVTNPVEDAIGALTAEQRATLLAALKTKPAAE